MIAVPAVLILTAPILLPIAIVGILVIRVKERTDRPEAGQVDFAHLEAVRAYEDFGAQNPLTAVGLVKPGLVRKLSMRAGLMGLDYANRHVFNRDNLAGVRSIHFARWVPLDEGRRLIFASSYDGSAESYMDDFINQLHWGINLIFSNGVGFPRTTWLIRGGAQDEIAYKNFLGRHQIPTPIFYSAYPAAHCGGHRHEFGVARRPVPAARRPGHPAMAGITVSGTAEVLDLNDMQGLLVRGYGAPSLCHLSTDPSDRAERRRRADGTVGNRGQRR